MIVFQKADTRVLAKMVVNLPGLGERELEFAFQAGNELAAGLLTRHMNERVSARIREVREKEYNAGFKAGRQKRRKENWFSGNLGRDAL